ncbi:MAG: transcription termination/antitermination protein NusG [Firmicutes bacterium]|nr:transcription termination/antitermination protein NusG [Bacillota bacterium]
MEEQELEQLNNELMEDKNESAGGEDALVLEQGADIAVVATDDDYDMMAPIAAIDSTKIAPASNIYRWYVLHTYSGYEVMVKDNLEMVFKKNNQEHRLDTISIPMEDSIEEKGGRKKIVKRKMFPCYVYIKMDYDNSLWHMITKTRGVTGFVGPLGRPSALTEDEVRRLKLEVPQVVHLAFEVGDTVRIIDGSFEGNDGKITMLDQAKARATVDVEAFGRVMPIEVELSQVQKLG